MNGKIKRAALILGGQRFLLIDSPAKHEFGFTPAMSIFVDCDSAPDIADKFAALSADGQIYMPLDNYGFSTRFAWIADRFGVSWQLNLP
jgi:predicted 3-demethylubiquinone-9 3-methyltransferase (glyoxalase superfamily)